MFYFTDSMAGKNFEPEYEATILVTRGDEMPKKNYEKKLHPTYEVTHTSTVSHSVYIT